MKNRTHATDSVISPPAGPRPIALPRLRNPRDRARGEENWKSLSLLDQRLVEEWKLEPQDPQDAVCLSANSPHYRNPDPRKCLPRSWRSLLLPNSIEIMCAMAHISNGMQTRRGHVQRPRPKICKSASPIHKTIPKATLQTLKHRSCTLGAKAFCWMLSLRKETP
jgi:hypothetical protein